MMINKTLKLRKEAVIHRALTAIAGVLTIIALICVVVFHTAPTLVSNMLKGQSSGVSSISDKVKFDSQTTGTAANGIGANPSYSVSGYGNTGTGSATSGTSADTAAGHDGTTDGSVSKSGTDTVAGGSGETSSGDGSTGGTNIGTTGSNTVAATVADDGAGAADGSGTPSGDSESSGNSGISAGSSSGPHKIKSACFGGVGRCYVGDR